MSDIYLKCKVEILNTDLDEDQLKPYVVVKPGDLVRLVDSQFTLTPDDNVFHCETLESKLPLFLLYPDEVEYTQTRKG